MRSGSAAEVDEALNGCAGLDGFDRRSDGARPPSIRDIPERMRPPLGTYVTPAPIDVHHDLERIANRPLQARLGRN
jgi:hypothetical protein